MKVLAQTYKKEILDLIPDVVKLCCVKMVSPSSNVEISTLNLDKIEALIPGLVKEKKASVTNTLAQIAGQVGDTAPFLQ